ncbi:MAG: hypothetical protein V2B15_08765 [Bacteroidota bacterium]
MKLETVKKSEFPPTRGCTSKPTISLSGKTGIIAINPVGVKHFSLGHGNAVGFCKDVEENPPEWFIILPPSAMESPDTFTLRKNSGRLVFTSKPLARKIIRDHLKKKEPNKKDHEIILDKVVHLRIAFEPVKDRDQEIPDTYALLGGTVYK